MPVYLGVDVNRINKTGRQYPQIPEMGFKVVMLHLIRSQMIFIMIMKKGPIDGPS